jgi:hypothetical protein
MDNKGYAGGFFAIAIDQSNMRERPGLGHMPSFVRSVDGGFLQGSVIAETLGGDLHQVKHLGTVDIQPINIEAGLASSRTLLEWIQQTWRLEASMRSGRVDHGSPTGGAIRNHLSQVFWDALITEVTFPGLSRDSDSGSNYLKVQIQPGRLKLLRGDDLALPSSNRGNQLRWANATFSFEVENREVPIAKIDAFSVKQHVKKLYTGRERLPELVPAALELANFSVYCNASQGDYFLDWYNERIDKGANEVQAERTGALIFKSQNGDELFELTLKNMGIFSLNIERSVAGGNDLKLYKIGLYVESVDLQITGAFD